MIEPTLKFEPSGYKLNPEKLKGASQSILPYILGCFYFTEEYEYFDKIKYYLDIPEPRKSIEELQQELDEKIEKLIENFKEKSKQSKQYAEYRYNQFCERQKYDFEYAREHGHFSRQLVFTVGDGLSVNTGSYEQSFIIKQGSKHEGYYTIGNRRYFKFYQPDKPNVIVRFFMRTCLGFYWVDEKDT
jgi:hypothetical protein